MSKEESRDADDLLREEGRDEFLSHIDDAPTVAPGWDEPVEQIKRKATKYRLKLTTAAALSAIEFPEVAFVVPRYIAQGLTIIAGRPKAGKSWLGLNIAVAVAAGDCVLNEDVEQGDVLYFALEDNPRRLQRRLNQLIPHGKKPERLHFATECTRTRQRRPRSD